jgi:hypothetical protein
MQKKSCINFLFLSLTFFIVFAITVPAFAVKPPSAASFGVSSSMALVGGSDSSSNYPLYGGGFHNIATYGSEVFVGFTSEEDFSNEIKVCVGYSDAGDWWEPDCSIAHGAYIDPTGVAIAVSSVANGRVIHVAYGEAGAIKYVKTGLYSGGSPVTVSGSISAMTYSKTIAADGLGNVHIAFTGNNAGMYYTSSSDGINFSEPISLTSAGNAQPSIAADSLGNVFVAWNEGSDVYLTKKLVGAGWDTPVRINGSYSGGYPSIAVYDASNIYVAWRGGSSGYLVSSSTTNWTPTLAVAGGFADVSLAVNSSNKLTIAFVCPETVGQGICISTSTDQNVSWSAPSIVVNYGDLKMPNIVADSSGKINIAFEAWGWVHFTKEQ